MPLQCVCSLVGTLWAVLRGAQSHSANGASGTASESIRPHYSSCSATVLFLPPPIFPSFFRSSPSTLFSFPFPPVHAVSPVWCAVALLRLLEHTSHPQRERARERDHHSWQLSHWLTWHPCWLRHQGKHCREGDTEGCGSVSFREEWGAGMEGH